MCLWLLFVVAAITSCAGSRVAALVRGGYAPTPDVAAPGEDVR
jgi:hypothetical protein